MIETLYDTTARVQGMPYRHLRLPGQCVMCNRIGTSSDEVFADLRVDLEVYGDVYLCLDCCTEVAKFIKYVNPTEVEHLREHLAAAQKAVDMMFKQLNYFGSVLNARITAVGDGMSLDDVNASIPVSETEYDADFINSVLVGNESEPA